MASGALKSIRDNTGSGNALIFLHGFSGDRDDTWDRFPLIVAAQVSDCDIYLLGYATTFQPDIVGIWSADPDLPILSTLLYTRIGIDPLVNYRSLTFVAHSMGGLVVQRALVDYEDLRSKVAHAIFFGTPSAGLKKAWWVRLWKRQLRNMGRDSKFIKDLRSRWDGKIGTEPSFDLMVVAGTKDQFVPPESSLAPFDPKFHRVVPGNHLDIVKPEDGQHESARLVISALSARDANVAPLAEAMAPLRLAAEQPRSDTAEVIASKGDTMSEAEIVEAALAFERQGKRDDSIRLLERYQALGTDVQGVLAGRIKRLWHEDGADEHARQALRLYQHALDQAVVNNDNGQVFYHAINVAFLRLVAFDQSDRAKEMAQLALRHCGQVEQDVWNVATQAEANLYLGNRDVALDLYQKVRKAKEVKDWQLASASFQAGQLAIKLGDKDLQEALEKIFSPGARQVSKIFISYSHKDREWLDRLHTMMKPYLREAEHEIDFWDDRRLRPGDKWLDEIKDALKTAGVAVVLVSADLLASDFVVEHELPDILRAAEEEGLNLLWVLLSPAAYDATPISAFQAAHDISRPLDSLSGPEQQQALLEVAQTIKQAALGATDQFTGHSAT